RPTLGSVTLPRLRPRQGDQVGRADAIASGPAPAALVLLVARLAIRLGEVAQPSLPPHRPHADTDPAGRRPVRRWRCRAPRPHASPDQDTPWSLRPSTCRSPTPVATPWWRSAARSTPQGTGAARLPEPGNRRRQPTAGG